MQPGKEKIEREISRKVFLVAFSFIVTILAVYAVGYTSSSTNFINSLAGFSFSQGTNQSSSNYTNKPGSAISGLAVGEVASEHYKDMQGSAVVLGVSEDLGLTATYIKDKISGSISYCNSTEVKVSFEATGNPTYYMASESSSFSGATWIAYSNTPNFSLSAQEGSKTVYAKIKDASTTTAAKNASIIYDPTSPSILCSIEGYTYKSGGDPISATPNLSVYVSDKYLDTSSFKFYIDDTLVTDGTNGSYDTWTPVSGVSTMGVVSYKPKTSLREGAHSAKFIVADFAANSTSQTMGNLEVKSGEADIVGKPLCYPNPVNIDQEPITISYTLTKACSLGIFVYDLGLRPVYKRIIEEGESGARAGYNEITWDGVSLFNEKVDNGPLFVRIVAQSGGTQRVIGKLKIMVLR